MSLSNFSINLTKIKPKQIGFTLIELIIGIVILSLSFSVIFSMILPAATQSAVQIHQIRAAELGQAMLNEIMGKAFDENSDMVSGIGRCGEDMDNDGYVDNCSTTMGSETGETRALFDDVDDYHGLNNSASAIENSLGDSLNDMYKGFNISVSVCNDSGYDGCGNGGDDNTAKLITIIVTTSVGESITFASYKANF